MSIRNDPIEEIVKTALVKAGVSFVRDAPLDFECGGFAVEVTQFYTARKIRQLEGREDVIFIQGRKAAEAFSALLESRQ